VPTFRFRGAAALEIAERQEQAAEGLLARAEADLSAARVRWETTRIRLRDAGSALTSTARSGAASHVLAWHRNWMTGLAVAADARGKEAEQLSVAVRRARLAWQTARRRRLTLERLRERALRRYSSAEQRREVKELEELARARYLAPVSSGERSPK
jgi:flagellar export protein FliJ